MKQLHIFCWVLTVFLLEGCSAEKTNEQSARVHITRYIDSSSRKEAMPWSQRMNYARKADSLAACLNDDSLSSLTTLNIATLHMEAGKTDSAQQYLLLCAGISQQHNDSLSLAVSYANLALLAGEMLQHDSAIYYFKEAQKIFRNTDSVKLAECMINEGILYKNMGVFKDAYDATVNAAEILQLHGQEKSLASAYTNLGNILKEMQGYKEANDYHQKALAIYIRQQDSSGIAATLNNIGNILRYAQKYREALTAYGKSLAIKEQLNIPKSLATTLDNMAATYMELKDYTRAESYFQKAVAIRKTANDTDGLITTSLRLSKLYSKKGQMREAEATALEALSAAQKKGLMKQVTEISRQLATMYDQAEQYRKAAYWGNRTMVLKDSLYGGQIQQAISEMETKYRMQQKNEELKHAKKLNGLHLLQIKNQRLIIVLMSVTVLLFLVLIVLLYRSSKFRKQAKEQVELLMKELSHRVKNNLQLISGLFNFQIASTENQQAKEALVAAHQRIESINIVHRLLQQSAYSGRVGMQHFFTSLLSNMEKMMQHSNVKYILDTETEAIDLDIEKAVSAGLIVNELVTNIYKYGQTVEKVISINVSFKKTGENLLQLMIKDNCARWDIKQAREKTSGSGLFLVETLVQQFRGKWIVDSSDSGNTHTISFKEK